MNNVYTVSELNALIEQELRLSPALKSLSVEAEVSRLTKHGRGHYYFTIKDDNASIDCVMFARSVYAMRAKEMDFNEGERLIFYGHVGIYKQNARLQFYVTSVELLGEGIYQRQFLELKAQLEKEGLLARKSSLEVPSTPEKILLITSKTSAAYRDFMKIFHQKNPFCKVELRPTTMQGESTALDVSRALDEVDDHDLVVITRGGGSYEDLRFFNDEALARKVAMMDVPIIAAIGHEIDFTMIELVASLRGATPSDAATRATADIRQLFMANAQLLASEHRSLALRLKNHQQYLDETKESLNFQIENKGSYVLQHIDGIAKAMTQTLTHYFEQEKVKLMHLKDMLKSRNPLNILDSGYTLTLVDGQVADPSQLKAGQRLETLFKTHKVSSEIVSLEERKTHELS